MSIRDRGNPGKDSVIHMVRTGELNEVCDRNAWNSRVTDDVSEVTCKKCLAIIDITTGKQQ